MTAMVKPILRWYCDRCGARWSSQTSECPHCAMLVNETPYADARPPPTGYRDERSVFHPGPGSDGYCGHLRECLPCFRAFGDALNRGERWAVVLSPLPQLPPIVMPVHGPPRGVVVPTCLPEPGEGALVTTPRSLPACWRRYAHPGPLLVGMAGGFALWQLPVAIRAVSIIALLVAAVTIRKSVPDTLPAARVRQPDTLPAARVRQPDTLPAARVRH